MNGFAKQKAGRKRRSPRMRPREDMELGVPQSPTVVPLLDGDVELDHLSLVDRAMFLKACEGNVAAAKLVYMRLLGEWRENNVMPEEPLSMEELERLFLALKSQKDGGSST